MNETLAKIFKLQSNLVMLGWIVLVFLPFWQYMPAVVMIVILVISLSYSYLIFFGHRYDEGARKPNMRDFFDLKSSYLPTLELCLGAGCII